jgi:formate C-acetyltransferase
MAEICAALKADFKGHEVMRQIQKNNKYRFGNDIPEVDEMANKVNAVHAEFATALTDPRGGHYICGIWPVDNHVNFGYKTGALPEGRNQGMPLADGVGACQGADISGPTALLNSVARLNNKEHWQGGNTCNIKFSRSSILSGNGLKNMSDLIEVFMRLGGQEVQINVVDAATLQRAQEDPKEYMDLVVRVAGYSAYFVTLSKDIQNEIISRTVQAV